MSEKKMICPRCGFEMNHHAFKIDYEPDSASKIDPAFGGVLKETHTCPHCGDVEFRDA
jgi:ribosomal protein S27AE